MLSIFYQNLSDLSLHDAEVGGHLQGVLHHGVVGRAVGLDALGMNGRALTEVEGTALQGHLVGRTAHLAAQRVDLVDEMSLGGTADGGIAGHIGDGVEGHGEKHGIHAEPGRGEGGLHTGVTGTDDRHARGRGKFVHIVHSYLLIDG